MQRGDKVSKENDGEVNMKSEQHETVKHCDVPEDNTNDDRSNLAIYIISSLVVVIPILIFIIVNITEINNSSNKIPHNTIQKGSNYINQKNAMKNPQGYDLSQNNIDNNSYSQNKISNNTTNNSLNTSVPNQNFNIGLKLSEEEYNSLLDDLRLTDYRDKEIFNPAIKKIIDSIENYTFRDSYDAALNGTRVASSYRKFGDEIVAKYGVPKNELTKKLVTLMANHYYYNSDWLISAGEYAKNKEDKKLLNTYDQNVQKAIMNGADLEGVKNEFISNKTSLLK